MAPSQMEHQQQQTLGQGYTHKKFNCGYSHKKLGMRLRNRQPEDNKENIEIITNQSPEIANNKSSKPTKGLFRPYALDDNNTPRKRKVSRSSEEAHNSVTTSPATSPNAYMPVHHQLTSYSTPAPAQTCAAPTLSPNSYALRLQRQRAALYMRYMSQFQQSPLTTTTSTTTTPPAPSHYATMGYPNVTAPIFNSC